MKLGLQLYQVDHRSYLLDFRNLNSPLDDVQSGGTKILRSPLYLFCSDLLGTENDAEVSRQNRSLSWDFTETDTGEETVSEVMQFFEMAASLIRTLAPDSSTAKSSSLI